MHRWTAIVAVLIAASAAAATPIALRDAGTAGFVGLAQDGPLDVPVLVDSYLAFAIVFGTVTDGLENPYLAPSVAAFFANGGQHLYVVRVAAADDDALIGTDGGSPETRTGLQALRDVAEVAVVAIPGAVSPAVQSALIAHGESGDRMAILDPAAMDDLDAVIAQRAGLDAATGHAALYFPWVQAAPAGEPLLLPPSGFVAGLYARTAPPDAPTGEVLTATDVSFTVTSAQQDLLTSLGINAIRVFAGSEVLVWGARTVSGDPEWRYVPVRRAADAIGASIRAGTAWCVQEPNDENLWFQLRSDVTDFMLELFLSGWFQGQTPDDAFFVRCDQTTMTALDILEGRTVILVGFAPLSPAEFVVLSIRHQRDLGTAAPDAPFEALRLQPPRPNPANPGTTLRFDLPRSGRASLRLYDLGGRLVRTLIADDDLPAGSHAWRWDGRDDAGDGVGSGVYLVRLTAGGATRAQRVTLVR